MVRCHWNYGQTVADVAKRFIDRCWEVVNELSFAATFHPTTKNLSTLCTQSLHMCQNSQGIRITFAV